jgi:hypothetical protein
MDRGFDVTGRETRGDFRSLPFDEQIQTVMLDLQDHFWHAQALVICNSFGAYLFGVASENGKNRTLSVH